MAGKQEQKGSWDYQKQFRQARDQDINFLRTASTGFLIEWFLDRYSKEKTGFKSLDQNHISPTEQIRILYGAVDRSTQKKVSDALVHAVAYWAPEEYTARQLEELAFAVVATGSEGAVPFFIQKIDDGSMRRAEIKDRTPITENVVSIVAGFAPNKYVKPAFDRWVKKGTLSPRLAGLLFVGRSHCDPDHYPTYLRDFWKVQERIPNYFQMRGFYLSLIHDQGIGVEAFVKGTKQFTPQERKRLLKDLDGCYGLEASRKNGRLCIKDLEGNKTYDCGSLSL